MTAPIVGDYSRQPWPAEHLQTIAESTVGQLRLEPCWADGQLWERVAER